MRRLSSIPIIYMGDIDSFELHFEGQTATRGNIVAVKEDPSTIVAEDPSAHSEK
nr:hypothetical protein [Tanacetum cinerariifolium]